MAEWIRGERRRRRKEMKGVPSVYKPDCACVSTMRAFSVTALHYIIYYNITVGTILYVSMRGKGEGA